MKGRKSTRRKETDGAPSRPVGRHRLAPECHTLQRRKHATLEAGMEAA